MYTVWDKEKPQEPTLTNTPKKVKKIVQQAWQKIFSTDKQYKNDHNKMVYLTTSFLKKAEAVKQHSHLLTEDFSKEELIEVLKKLSTKKQPGPDRLPNEILKYLRKSDLYLDNMLKMFNLCLRNGWTPESWMDSNLYLIYKSGDPANPLNYRPIALLNIRYKVYNSLINSRLSNFLEKYNILSNIQGGFRKNKTTHHKIWTLINIIEHSMYLDKELHVCYIDVKKAYDHVEHWGIKQVMEMYGYDPHFINIIMSLYRSTKTQVITPYGLTDNINVTRGVRQGCPLSPTLFILFLDPVLLQIEEGKKRYQMDHLNIPGLAFADDLALTNSYNRNLQKSLNMLQIYFEHYRLYISIDDRDKSVYTNNRPNTTSHELKVYNLLEYQTVHYTQQGIKDTTLS